MFTGLVERTGRVISFDQPQGQKSAFTLSVNPGDEFDRTFGASVAVNGVCLTEVGHLGAGNLSFHVSHETIEKTSLSTLRPGDLVNLERAMRPMDRLGGHIVLGHVDGTASISEISQQGAFWILKLALPAALGRYVISKGSIAIDGTSLTVNKVKDEGAFSVVSFMLIPTTWTMTRFHVTKPGDQVNVEVDMIAKHVERLLAPRLGG